MTTEFCKKLGIEHPIVQAPIGNAAVPQLAAAVSNAHALGMLALTWASDVAAAVGETAALTRRPFGGNLVLAWDQHRRLDEALGAGLRIVSLTWGDPEATWRKPMTPAPWFFIRWVVPRGLAAPRPLASMSSWRRAGRLAVTSGAR